MLHSRHVLAAAAIAAIGLMPATASAQVVKNGGFESPTVAGCCNTAPPDSVDFWTVTSGNVNVVNGKFNGTDTSGPNLAAEGNQYLDLVGQGGTGSIVQTLLGLTPGVVYNLTFDYSNNGFTPSSSTSASAGFSIDDLIGTVTHNTANSTDLDWRVFSGSFTATGNDVLSFANVTGGRNEGVLLDAISVAPVPEPATWAMMLLGFGGIGMAVRRRRKQHSSLPQFA